MSEIAPNTEAFRANKPNQPVETDLPGALGEVLQGGDLTFDFLTAPPFVTAENRRIGVEQDLIAVLGVGHSRLGLIRVKYGGETGLAVSRILPPDESQKMRANMICFMRPGNTVNLDQADSDRDDLTTAKNPCTVSFEDGQVVICGDNPNGIRVIRFDPEVSEKGIVRGALQKIRVRGGNKQPNVVVPVRDVLDDLRRWSVSSDELRYTFDNSSDGGEEHTQVAPVELVRVWTNGSVVCSGNERRGLWDRGLSGEQDDTLPMLSPPDDSSRRASETGESSSLDNPYRTQLGHTYRLDVIAPRKPEIEEVDSEQACIAQEKFLRTMKDDELERLGLTGRTEQVLSDLLLSKKGCERVASMLAERLDMLIGDSTNSERYPKTETHYMVEARPYEVPYTTGSYNTAMNNVPSENFAFPFDIVWNRERTYNNEPRTGLQGNQKMLPRERVVQLAMAHLTGQYKDSGQVSDIDWLVYRHNSGNNYFMPALPQHRASAEVLLYGEVGVNRVL